MHIPEIAIFSDCTTVASLMNDITPLKNSKSNKSLHHSDSSGSTNSSQELNYEPDIYNLQNDDRQDAVSEFRHSIQNSTEDLLNAHSTDLNGTDICIILILYYRFSHIGV